MKQKEYLESIEGILLPRNRDNKAIIYTTRNWKNNDKFTPSKQVILGKLDPAIQPIDHRSIGLNEVIIELDAKSFSQNVDYARRIKIYLNTQEISHYCWWSGNKSVHIHIFLNPDIDIKNEKIQEVLVNALKQQWNIWRDIRLRFAKEIISQAGINPFLIGIGKVIDLQKLAWNDLSRAPLIRCEGGRHQRVNDSSGSIITSHKTYLMDLPNRKPEIITDIADVNFPAAIETYSLSEDWIGQAAQDYLDSIKSNPIEFKPIDYKGKFLSLPCVAQLLEKEIKEGQRAFGAKILAIACKLDGLPESSAVQVFEDYVKRCKQLPSNFSLPEAIKWMDWIYKQTETYWACGNCVTLGICDRFDCPFHKEKYKEILDVLGSEPLTMVKRELDKTIVGEDELKMALFMIYMTKDINPEWTIIIDGVPSVGKSYVMKAVANLFGEEGKAWIDFSRISGAGLNYVDEETAKDWKGKIMVIEEIQGSEAARSQLRVLISEHKLNLWLAEEIIDKDGTKKRKGMFKTVALTNTLFVTSDAESEDIGGQLSTRAWWLNPDSGVDQTRKIIQQKIRNFTETDRIKYDIKVTEAINQLANPDDYLWPFEQELCELELVQADSVRGRRDISKYLALIKVSAKLHQNDRLRIHKNGKNYLVCDWRDVQIIIQLLQSVFRASSHNMGRDDWETFEVVEAKLKSNGQTCFIREEATQIIKDSLGKVMTVDRMKKMLGRWCNAGVIENTSPPGCVGNYFLQPATGGSRKHTATSLRMEIEKKIAEQAEKLQEFCQRFKDEK